MAASPLAARASARSVVRVATPLTFRRAARWKRRTVWTVPVPYWPSAVVLKPALRSSCCSALTASPLSPGRSVRSPTRADISAETCASACAKAGTNSTQAAANAAASPTKNDRYDDDTELTPLFGGAYGVSCRARAKRVALHRTTATIRPGPDHLRPVGPPLPTDELGGDSAGTTARAM